MVIFFFKSAGVGSSCCCSLGGQLTVVRGTDSAPAAHWSLVLPEQLCAALAPSIFIKNRDNGVACVARLEAVRTVSGTHCSEVGGLWLLVS